ncbi:MAG: hypothetical protein AB3K77_12250 [Methanosarcinaceae archaeon]|uniref:hypothetical protein n=1 Tax=Methanosarcina sp. MTP4 TaxID=1434100 RepID=UPI000B1A8ECD|nr:hypothetical protein [Methanosarcina sp. MTP4]
MLQTTFILLLKQADRIGTVRGGPPDPVTAAGSLPAQRLTTLPPFQTGRHPFIE